MCVGGQICREKKKVLSKFLSTVGILKGQTFASVGYYHVQPAVFVSKPVHDV